MFYKGGAGPTQNLHDDGGDDSDDDGDGNGRVVKMSTTRQADPWGNRLTTQQPIT